MRWVNALWFALVTACFACAVIKTSSGGEVAKIRIGSSHVVDSSGDKWLVHGFDSDSRGLLVVGVCANDAGNCAHTSWLVPLSDVEEVIP